MCYKKTLERYLSNEIDCIEELLVEKETLTPDIGGTSTTSEVGDAMIRKLRERRDA